MSRTDILRGPAIIQYQAQTFYSQGDITVTLGRETFAVNVANFGKVDDRVDQIMHQISFTPAGQWAALGVLFPYASALIGPASLAQTRQSPSGPSMARSVCTKQAR
ncbi:hypothetical protein [Verrucomicrobium spinosum]|uniref:hypothetical protein n=1 Tax=Verrucomicrobium spinosum TaxID=2736 RepID=UPI00210DBD6B|nr:hypothetical protein [Verrucomicrobium spinosum]